jgi:hypothetical protein
MREATREKSSEMELEKVFHFARRIIRMRRKQVDRQHSDSRSARHDFVSRKSE